MSRASPPVLKMARQDILLTKMMFSWKAVILYIRFKMSVDWQDIFNPGFLEKVSFLPYFLQEFWVITEMSLWLTFGYYLCSYSEINYRSNLLIVFGSDETSLFLVFSYFFRGNILEHFIHWIIHFSHNLVIYRYSGGKFQWKQRKSLCSKIYLILIFVNLIVRL